MNGAGDVNRRYFVHYVRTNAAPGARVLDHGCGAGTTVALLRDAGFDAYGVDIR
jgi:2-polyprenyl-3-methyl-5-hydroxy-6-metoxy-1,4-benzoquinol methylase